MPVNPNELRLFATGPAPGGTGAPVNIYQLITNDTAAAVEANGYFDGVFENGLNKGDLILACVDHDGTIGWNIYGVSVGGADVTVADVFAQHA